MKEIADILIEFDRRRDQPLALATLVRVTGSSYRRPGARMLIALDGHRTGVLSAGCLEDEIAATAPGVVSSNQPILLHFDTRRYFGCSGTIDILVEKLQPEFLRAVRATLDLRRACVVETVFAQSGSLGSRVLPAEPIEFGGARLVQTITPCVRLLLLGHGPESAPLSAIAHILGWEVIENRSAAFLPDEIDEWTAVLVHTHQYGRDYSALARLMPMELPYVALLGPRRRCAQILHVLLQEKVNLRSELFAPAGLDLGAESPEEIALAIVAEIQARFARASGLSLRDRKSPIHASPELFRV